MTSDTFDIFGYFMKIFIRYHLDYSNISLLDTMWICQALLGCPLDIFLGHVIWYLWDIEMGYLYKPRFAATMHAWSCSQACDTIDFLHSMGMPNKSWISISLNRSSMIGVGLGASLEVEIKSDYNRVNGLFELRDQNAKVFSIPDLA